MSLPFHNYLEKLEKLPLFISKQKLASKNVV